MKRMMMAAFFVVGLGLMQGAEAADFTKDNNATALNDDASWVGTGVPGASDTAVWDSTVTSANNAALGADTSWLGVRILSPGGLVTIGTGANILTLGTGGIDMSLATQSLYLNGANTSVGANNQVWNVGSSYLRLGAGNLAGVLSGSGIITISGNGIVDLNPTTTGASNFSGKWIIDSGATLRTTRHSRSGDWDALGSSTSADAVTLNGGTLAVGGFTGSGAQGNWTWANPITLAAATSSKISGQLPDTIVQNRSLNFTGAMTGSGDLTFEKNQLNAMTFSMQNFGATSGDRTDVLGTGNITVNGVTLELRPSGTGAGVAFTLNNNFKLIGGTLVDFDGNDMTLKGNITLEGANAIQSHWSGKDLILDGTIQDGTVAGSVQFRPGANETANAIYVNGHNTYTGGTTLGDSNGNKGVVVAQHADAFGTGTINSRGAQLRAGTAGMTILNPIGVANGGLRVGGANSFALSGTITVDNSSRSIANYGAAVVTLGNIDVNAGTASKAAFDVGGEFVVNGKITGQGAVSVSAGAVTLNGASDYTGATTLSGGRLNLNGSLTSPITVSAGTLAGTGSSSGLLTMSGGGLALAGGGATAGLTVNGVTFSSATKASFDVYPVASTVYDVLTYGAGAVTTPGNLSVAAHGTLTDDTVNQKFTFMAAGAQTRTWNTASGAWDIGATANFQEGDQLFYNWDTVIFPEPAAAGAVTLSGRLAPASVTVNNTANDYTFTGTAGSADITGAASLTKNNAGLLKIASQQTYTGGTTVNGGILDLTGGGGSGGAIRGTVTVNSGGTLRLSNGDVLGYNNDATAVNTIHLVGGILTSAAGANQTTTAKFHLTGGTIDGTVNLDLFSNNSSVTTYASDNPSTISVSTMNLRQNDTVFDVADGGAANDLQISSAIGNGSAGNHNMIKDGAGTMVLSGNNVFTGNITINGGVLELAASGKLYNGAYNNTAVVTVNAGATWRMPDFSYGGVGQLADYAARRVIDGGAIEVTGGTHSSGQDFTVAAAGGTFRYNPATATDTLTLAGNANDNIQLNGTLTLDAVGNVTIDEIMQGAGGLTKTGGGTLTLSPSNTYGGATTVDAGKLLVNGTHTGAGLITVNNGTLGGRGTVGPVTVNSGGTLAPGESIGTFTVNGDLSLAGTLDIEVDGAGLGSVDLLNVSGLLDISSATVKFQALSALDDVYVFAAYGSLNGSQFNSVVNLPSGYSIDYAYAGNQIALIPEPASLWLMAGLLAVAWIRRRMRG